MFRTVAYSICASKPQLEEIRNALLSQKPDSVCFQIDRLNANEYKPFHGVAFERNEQYAQVQVRLLGWLAFRVHFRKLRIHAPRCAYTHFLDTNLEDLRIIENDY